MANEMTKHDNDKAQRKVVRDKGLNRTSPIKARRTENQVEDIRAAIYWLLQDDNPMTVRQVFYRLVSMGAVGKTEAEYKGTVCRLLVEMRRGGLIPFGWIADNTRWQRKPTTFNSLEDALTRTAQTYRRAVWEEQDAYVEVWLEKDALAGVVMDVTVEWDVPLMVTRGYPSLTFIHGAAATIARCGKPVYLYYLGDYDPSGLDIPRTVERGIREFAPWAKVHFERVAVTPAQIEEFSLITRPTKKTDSRSRNFAGESVEVDAIPPDTLRELVRGCIMRHVDTHAQEVLEVAEKSEREQLQKIAASVLRYGQQRNSQ
jgi:hypothetical protein